MLDTKLLCFSLTIKNQLINCLISQSVYVCCKYRCLLVITCIFREQLSISSFFIVLCISEIELGFLVLYSSACTCWAILLTIVFASLICKLLLALFLLMCAASVSFTGFLLHTSLRSLVYAILIILLYQEINTCTVPETS